MTAAQKAQKIRFIGICCNCSNLDNRYRVRANEPLSTNTMSSSAPVSEVASREGQGMTRYRQKVHRSSTTEVYGEEIYLRWRSLYRLPQVHGMEYGSLVPAVFPSPPCHSPSWEFYCLDTISVWYIQSKLYQFIAQQGPVRQANSVVSSELYRLLRQPAVRSTHQLVDNLSLGVKPATCTFRSAQSHVNLLIQAALVLRCRFPRRAQIVP